MDIQQQLQKVKENITLLSHSRARIRQALTDMIAIEEQIASSVVTAAPSRETVTEGEEE